MAKPEKKKKKVHLTVKKIHSKEIWKTACGLRFDSDERKEVILTWEIQHTTCRACKENYVVPKPE